MILVTGGTGLVGSHLLYDLLSKGEKVRALKRKNSKIEQVEKVFSYYSSDYKELFNKIEWLEGDVQDDFSLEEALKDVRDVYHCAAMVSFHKKDKRKLFEINVEGTRNLVDACVDAKIHKFCMVSSIAALGTPEEGEDTVDETSPWSPEDKRSNYSLSKFQSELEVWRAIEEGLNAVIVNPSVILGPGYWEKGSSQLFSTVAKGLKYYTKGITGYVDVRDVSKAMIQLMESNITNERFILNGDNCTYQYLFETIAKYLNVKQAKIYATPQLTEIAWRLAAVKSIFTFSKNSFTKETARASHNCKNYSNQKIKDAIAFEFTSIEDSIRDTAKHYPLQAKVMK
jgi:nucleoside-diphosphate-sugar epimerase